MTGSPVRPTRRSLEDMGLAVPYLTEPLHELAHPVLEKAQQLPAQHRSGGAERVLCLSDRLWFKVKTGRGRGAATLLGAEESRHDGRTALRELAQWWLGACGHREDGSRADFYARLQAEAEGRGPGGSSGTQHLIPGDWDWTRLELEQPEAWRRTMSGIVLALVAASIRTGKEYVAEFRHHRVSALVRAEDGHDAYLAVVAEGIPDVRVIAVILASVPGIPSDHWLPDPDGPGDRRAASGEIVWSTIIPPEVTRRILDMIPDEDDA